MQENTFQIVLNMYVGNGYTEIGRFFIGGAEQHVLELYEQFQGNRIIEDKVFIRLDVISHQRDSLDTVLMTLGCTLNEMNENVKIIMKETFIRLNLI